MNRVSKLLITAILLITGGCVTLKTIESVSIRYDHAERNPDFEKQIQTSVANILSFAKKNGLTSDFGPSFVSEAVLYGSKPSFDDFMMTQPDWPKNKEVPKSYVGVGENKKFHVVEWAAYKNIFPDSTIDDYQKLITHELTHLFHIAYLKSKEDEMGPIWFYEGFACVVADQFPDEPLPPNDKIKEILSSPERGSYKLYSAILRKILRTESIKNLVDHANDPAFSKIAEATLLK